MLAIDLHGTAFVTLACGKRWLADTHAGDVLSIVATCAETGSPHVVPSAMAKALPSCWPGGSACINGEVVVIDGGEWLKGAGQFSLVEVLGEDDWRR